MIFDCFLFNNELELLELRVNELKKCKSPITHVLVESKYTFTGIEKPLHFEENKDKFMDFPIMSVAITNKIDATAWERESFQRDAIANALKLFNPDDDNIVILSDVDEVPKSGSIDSFVPETRFASLMMDKYGYYLNCLEGVQSWNRARIMTYKYLSDKTPEQVRNSGFDNVIKDAGWHWSWLGGVDRIVEKFNSFSHQELNTDQYANPEKLKNKLQTGQSLWTDEEGDRWKFVEIDNTYPEYLVNNIDKFKHLIHAI